jgi:signal transduction histidine kinase
VLIVWVARWLSYPIVEDQASFSFFFLAVSVAAWLGGVWPAVFTAVVSCIVGNESFSHFGRIRISELQEIIGMAMFLLISGFIGVLAEVSLRALDRARKAERAKDDFMATVAHELRSPLSVIHYANALDRLTSDQQARDHIDLIDEQVVHLNVMIQDLLDVSRVARGKIRLDRRQVDASTLVDGAVVKAKPTIASREHELTVDVVDEPMPLYVDPVRMEQVLANLLINAAKYTPNGGRITIRVAPVGDSVEFVVRDNGIGISEEMLPRVFDLFVQADSDGKTAEGGLGIGLAVVQKIVSMHDGSVHAASAGLNHGSEFTVCLPLEKAAPTTPALVEA